MRDERTANTCRQPNPDQTKADHLHGMPSAVSAHRVPVDPKRPPGFFAKKISGGRGRRQAATGWMPAVSWTQMMYCISSQTDGVGYVHKLCIVALRRRESKRSHLS
jgi:hypothetical protein